MFPCKGLYAWQTRPLETSVLTLFPLKCPTATVCGVSSFVFPREQV